MENEEIRLKARGAGVPLWQIAKHIGVSEPTMTRMLRQKVDKETKQRLLTAIKEIKAHRNTVSCEENEQP